MPLIVLLCLILKLVLTFEIRTESSDQSLDTNTAEHVWKAAACGSTDKYLNLSDFSFNARKVPVEDTLCLSLRMFNESGVIDMFNISAPILGKFILKVQRGYRQVPYHNWLHGFSVLQFSFAMIKTCRILERNHFSPLEVLALLTAAMCHDLDHPGFNNKYQEEVNSSLAQKYKTQGSILERHHIDMTFNILKNLDSNFITHFDDNKKIQFKELISQIIIATDLSGHLKLLPEIKRMSSDGFVETDKRHKQLLRSIIISCADLSDQARGWDVSRSSARLILTEFFAQGDKEKLLGLIPSEMMDRDKAEVPQLEVDFLTHVVVPNFKILKELYPETKICFDNTQQNLIYWQKSKAYFQKQANQGRAPLDILTDKELSNVFSLEIIPQN